MRKVFAFLVVGTIFSAAQIARAGVFEDGMAAYGQGGWTAAVKLWRPLADQGNAEAQFYLGYQYWTGMGVPKDHIEAVKLYRASAEQGFALAQYNLGKALEEGDSVPQNYKEAVSWYLKAAEQGHGPSQYLLGYDFFHGQGVPQNTIRAYTWFNLAASQMDNQKDEAINWRDQLAKIMTRGQIEEAQNLSRKCLQNDFKNCDDMPTSVKPITVTINKELAVSMEDDGGVYKVPVTINDTITLKFIVDSGATDVSIPGDVLSTLMRSGTIDASDVLGSRSYEIANGTTYSSQTFRIRSLKVGGIVLENVTASASPPQSPMLLGQSFLGHFKSWSIDNAKHALVLE